MERGGGRVSETTEQPGEGRVRKLRWRWKNNWWGNWGKSTWSGEIEAAGQVGL